jgi:hypothetical protein
MKHIVIAATYIAFSNAFLKAALFVALSAISSVNPVLLIATPRNITTFINK